MGWDFISFLCVYILDSSRCERVGRVLLVDVVGGTMDMSERRRLCSRCVNSTSLRLPRVVKNSGLFYLLVMNVAVSGLTCVGCC